MVYTARNFDDCGAVEQRLPAADELPTWQRWGGPPI
jgi:hypothetical protein